MRQCPFDDPNQGQFARIAETGITPSTEINEDETVLKTQKEREEIEAKREKNDETGRLRKNGKKEDVEDDQNHGIEMLLPLTLMERLNSTKKEKSAEEKGESAEIAIVMSEIPTKRKRNAGKGTRIPKLRRKRSESKSRRTADGMSRQMSKMTLNDDADGLDAEERRERRREKKRRSRSKIRSKDPSEIPADDLEALIKASHRARDRSTDGQIRRKKKTRDPSTKRNRNRHHDQSTERPSAQV
ncbi:unnamed protein product [Oikopleura dioica]|uniref:Uncharacterized protein n=1 Tax=Oikopleura dioica TaxID=34765 RepID=E4YRF8_OIKDI|nr:unnamed protein product [Oikopleura dioica]